MSKTTRRDFLKTASASALVAGAAGDAFSAEREPQQTVSPNDRIQIALIGAGGQGSSDTNVALRTGGVEVVAVADIYDGRLARAKEVWGKDVFTTRDYREVLARTDVDAVIIATPDHWHQQISIDAMNAGKDVYCEKPMVQLIEEGHRVIETEQKTKRILQVGSQRVSSVIYHKAKELLASGIIGELNLVEAWINRRSPIAAWQYTLP
ncbi:MAG TPA: Gfo/Idh/MocA family oxidoreductase, partial [Blastocatellia bacterium]